MMARAPHLLLLLLGVLPGALQAQGQPSSPWGVEAGGRVAYAFQGSAPVLGAFVRVGLPGAFTVQGGGELVFLDGLTERQIGGEVLYAIGPALHVGGGPVWRNTVFEPGDDPELRDTRLGYGIVVLLGETASRSGASVGIEFRYSSVSDLGQRTLGLHVAIPLVGRR